MKILIGHVNIKKKKDLYVESVTKSKQEWGKRGTPDSKLKETPCFQACADTDLARKIGGLLKFTFWVAQQQFIKQYQWNILLVRNQQEWREIFRDLTLTASAKKTCIEETKGNRKTVSHRPTK